MSEFESESSPEPTGDLLARKRNDLAVIRTDLANERTLLAYLRTSLMMVGTGGTLIKFFGESRELLITGYVAIGIGVVVILAGCIRFIKTMKRVRLDHQ
jgi:putative membrane protein